MLEYILKVKIIKFKADLFNLQKRIAFYTILKMFFILLEYTKKFILVQIILKKYEHK